MTLPQYRTASFKLHSGKKQSNITTKESRGNTNRSAFHDISVEVNFLRMRTDAIGYAFSEIECFAGCTSRSYIDFYQPHALNSKSLIQQPRSSSPDCIVDESLSNNSDSQESERDEAPPESLKVTPTEPAPSFEEYVNLYSRNAMCMCCLVKRLFGSRLASLYVGAERKVFLAHKKILCERGPHFKAMFDSGFAEAIYSQEIFPKDDPSAFNTLIKWIYTRKLPAMIKRVILIHGVGEETRKIWDPIDLYCLADKLCLDELIIATMDAWIKALKENNCMPSCEIIRSAYLTTGARSPPRRFISRMVFWAEALYLRDNADPVLRATFLRLIKAQDPLGEM